MWLGFSGANKNNSFIKSTIFDTFLPFRLLTYNQILYYNHRFLTPNYGIFNDMTNELKILNEIEKAVALCEKGYSHKEILDVLKTENDFEKQICLLKLDKITNQEEANLLVFQLTEHHGLIREATAIKINEFAKNPNSVVFFKTEQILDSLLKAVNDINPNICRLICDILPYVMENNIVEKQYFLNNLYKRFYEIFEELEKLKRSNWYTKKLFNLYWSLEALGELKPNITETLENILQKTALFRDYTIREKTAMVLSLLEETSMTLEKIKTKLKNDDNFYVKRFSQKF